MRTAALVLGILAGLFGILAGFLAMALGGFAYAVHASRGHNLAPLGFAAIVMSLLAMAGGALALKYPRLAALLQFVSCAGGFVAISLLWILSGPLLLVGAALAFSARDPKARAIDDINARRWRIVRRAAL